MSALDGAATLLAQGERDALAKNDITFNSKLISIINDTNALLKSLWEAKLAAGKLMVHN
jgi:hypothetical protein